ncbi:MULTISPECIES: hypothetical protein [Bacillus]|uniref:Uncharacterized protein n=2 Tax=Bacillus TaxID=1386 RepID=A0AAJ4D2X3_9BACI|nr:MULTISPECIES: hypothetical protein [Bacillus]KKB71696.1 hypothetical protein TH62_21205 [Bacillus sp. TH008]MBU8785230.1 hypothetical protein [Bacillus glycinifermentans]MDU0069693.1 hypothetical protein [Bacillus sp. IG6]MED8017980.1 hypothetical protein [Bacillus glycinifermentans]NUJ15399.1 hypothetical protein [Bacillus glycinifermentans]
MREEQHVISAISYHKTEKIIEFNQQKYLKIKHRLNLYKDKIQSANRQFRLEHIHDISYRPFTDAGLLYLHTNQGVFAFEINGDPGHFIHSYKKLKSSIK